MTTTKTKAWLNAWLPVIGVALFMLLVVLFLCTATPRGTGPSRIDPDNSGGSVTTSAYYPRVPKDFRANLEFRRDAVRLGFQDREAARELWIASKRDFLFWVNTFGWTYDPRKINTPALPFITYPYQDKSLLGLNAAIEQGHDLLIEKSRDMGASWMIVALYAWRWQFYDLQSFLMASRKEDLVDKPQDPVSLFWKLDFLISHQPDWMRPNLTRQKLHLYNLDTESTIDGTSTTADLAVGDRRTSMLLDEFSKVEDSYAVKKNTADVTRCRIFNGTPEGTANAFYTIAHDGFTPKLRLHWSEHPEKALGLYADASGRLRSPWYDAEVKRRGNPKEVAEQLDIDYLGSSYGFFGTDLLDRIATEFVRTPFWQGDLLYDRDSAQPLSLSQREGGPLWLWKYPPVGTKGFTDAQYVVGADVSMGTGASNSAASVADPSTGEKVAEWAMPTMPPTDFAVFCVALARLFAGREGSGAKLIWEAAGPGRSFGSRVMESGFSNFYFRTDDKLVSRKMSDVPGFWPTLDSKNDLLERYKDALRDARFINRSSRALAEAREYIVFENRAVGHARSGNATDPTGARENHGDIVIADALACKLIRESPSRAKPSQPEIPLCCLAARREARQDKDRAREVY